jgi:PAS domain S-box-containing protein
MLGYESAEQVLALDMNSDVYLDPTQRSRVVEEYVKTEGIRRLEVAWKRKDGKPIAVLLSGRPVASEQEEVEYFEVIAEDVTEQQKLTAQLRQAQKMEAVGQLTSGIAHDFNNVLSIILSNVQLLAGDARYREADGAASLHEIEDAAQRGASMVRQLMSFSRRADLTIAPADVGSILERTASMIRRLLPENIDVTVQADDARTYALVDEAALEQIVVNLANNARDAMPDGGSLGFAVKNVVLGKDEQEIHPWILPGDYGCLSVSDTGIGMDADTQARIFEPFFTTKPPGVGTGMGMAMVYGLMKQMRGFVHVYSEPDCGTTVKLYVPSDHLGPQPAREPPVERAGDEENRGGTETILLVEDEDGLRRAGKKLLERFGYTVLTASNGEEGLDVYGVDPSSIDLVISDVVMPRMGGQEFYKALKANGSTSKFLLASGYRRTDTREWLAQTLHVPYLEKPWTVASLTRRVREVLDGNEK